MSLYKQYKRYGEITIIFINRSITSGGTNDVVGSKKMHLNNFKSILTHWKILNYLKQYLKSLSNTDLLENAFNKEIAHYFQKNQPKVYGGNLIRYFSQQSLTVEEEKVKKIKSKDQSISFSLPDILGTLKIKMGDSVLVTSKSKASKWHIKPSISKETMSIRIADMLTSIKSIKKDNEKLTKLEEICDYMKKYDDAVYIAGKSDAVKTLLKVRQHNNNSHVGALLNEALALLGHNDPVKGAGLRILSIDGGGTRGLLAIQILKKLEELTGKSILDMFDLICGVSTGAIIASLLVVRKKSLEEIENIYQDIGTKVFTQHPIKGTSNLVWSHSYYDTALWEGLLKDEVGEEILISTQRRPNTPKLMTVSAIVNQSRLTAYVFRNYNLPCKVQSQYIGGSNHHVWEAVRASAAAPTYFEEYKLGNALHQDGGILVNNPTAVAIHEAKLLWPETPLQCVISCGTGRTAPNPIDQNVNLEDNISASSWKSKFLAVIDSATDTEGVHSMLSDLLPPKTYYRFNPYLTEMLGISEINPEKMSQLKRDAMMYLRRNEDKFQEAADTLNINKSLMQKLTESIQLQLKINGIVSSKY